MWLALYEMMGTPFSYKKFKGGWRVQVIGYELDFQSHALGITAARGKYIADWVEKAKQSHYVVQTRDFSEFLGRLGFVARVLHWLKPHLAWSAATAPGLTATLPLTVILVLSYVNMLLSRESYKISAAQPTVHREAAFHTDAKCADGFVVLGGWESLGKAPKDAKWFSLKLGPNEVPYLFDEKGGSQWASASAELLGTLAALFAFGWLQPTFRQRRLPVNVTAATDNRGNEALRRKLSTTKWPLMLVNIQLSDLLMAAGLTLSLNWKPRDENVLADQLTNEVFTSFSAQHRVSLSFSDLPLGILSELWETKMQFESSRKAAQMVRTDKHPRKKQKHQKTAW